MLKTMGKYYIGSNKIFGDNSKVAIFETMEKYWDLPAKYLC